MRAETQRERELVRYYLNDWVNSDRINLADYFNDKSELRDRLNLEECVGKVVKDKESESPFMAYISKVSNGGVEWFGFDETGCWTTYEGRITGDIESTCILATSEEWLERLKEEAVKRGYKDGAKVKCLNMGDINPVSGSYFNNKKSSILCSNIIGSPIGQTIMQDGIWAEIINDEPVEITLEEIAKLKGVSVEQIKIVK